jgi:hypothetical protein
MAVAPSQLWRFEEVIELARHGLSLHWQLGMPLKLALPDSDPKKILRSRNYLKW